MKRLQRLALVLATTTAIAALCAGSASASPTITPSGTTATFHSSAFNITIVAFGVSAMTFACSSSTWSATINGTTSAVLAGSLTLLFCVATILGMSCAMPLTSGIGGSWTATTNLGGGTYNFGVAMPSLGFNVGGCLKGCSISFAAQTLTDATIVWTNSTRQLAVSDNTYAYTLSGCSPLPNGVGTITATYAQTTTPNMVVTGS